MCGGTLLQRFRPWMQLARGVTQNFLDNMYICDCLGLAYITMARVVGVLSEGHVRIQYMNSKALLRYALCSLLAWMQARISWIDN